jgi:DNA polymerase (family 10)
MDAKAIAAILDEIGTLLELQGENPFRANAYHQGARALEQHGGDLADLVARKELHTVPGIGKTLEEKITTLVETGHLPFYDQLKAKTPPGLLELLKVPSLGPKKIKALYEKIGVDSLAALKAACQANQIAGLKGFGAKTQQKLLEGIAFFDRTGKRYLINEAEARGLALVERLKKLQAVRRIEICGSLRRRRETVADLDILVSSDDAAAVMDAFVHHPDVEQVLGHGPTRSSVVLKNGMQADLRVVKDAEYPFALHYFTGSKEHNIAIRARAQAYGLKLNEYGLAGEKKAVKAKDEADIFHALDLDYIPPELREATGEIEAAAAHQLPDLVTAADLKGTFHCHTTDSDGTASVEDMAKAAKALGFTYLGIGDHSQSLKVANGLTLERLEQQWAAIERVNAKMKGFHLLKGTECDILGDGRLDYPDQVLARFDYVVVSVHTLMNQQRDEMTARIIKAVSHPRATMLGHMTGRLLLRRDSYAVDQEAVFRAAARHGVLIEINAHPQRLDLDWLGCKKAKALGVKFVINPDAHSTAEIALTRFGVDVARRGWLEKEDIINCLPYATIMKRLKAYGGKLVGA